MDDTTAARAVRDEGVNFDWLLTRGADMTWHYGFEVQSYLADIDAAFAAEDWPTCVASCTLALRVLAECTYRGTGISAVTEAEKQLRLACDPSVVGQAYRAMPDAAERGDHRGGHGGGAEMRRMGTGAASLDGAAAAEQVRFPAVDAPLSVHSSGANFEGSVPRVPEGYRDLPSAKGGSVMKDHVTYPG
ncbi:hypothetical protein ABZT02_41360 [Streptomyces sp. NPDC005402]|uniref:hypothetical protein n=1 Tax=Streptomyces sp. NPDC005402 TaxID=3155338 RepID=UPI0033A66A68